MHMADALVAPAVAGTMAVCSAAAAGISIYKLRLEDDQKKIPVMGVMGAFVFAAQMINFTIPGTGSSGHLCGGLLLAALLGPCAAFLTMIGVLLIQCLFFADGGLLALGCNVWNMAFYGCFVGALLIWKPIMGNGASKKKITAASIVGCVLTLQMGAFSVAVETLLSGITELPFAVFVAAMQPIHLAIGLVEGLITAAVLCFIYEARPELLWGVSAERGGRLSFRRTIGIFAVLAVAVGGVLSPFASSLPDGLEWAVEKVAGTAEIGAASADDADAAAVAAEDAANASADGGGAAAAAEGAANASVDGAGAAIAAEGAANASVDGAGAAAAAEGVANAGADGAEVAAEGAADVSASAGSVYDTASRIQEATSILPDYAFKNSESAAGTTVSGLVGSLIVVGFCAAACWLFRFFRGKRRGNSGR